MLVSDVANVLSVVTKQIPWACFTAEQEHLKFLSILDFQRQAIPIIRLS
jgi:hypothetical protein